MVMKIGMVMVMMLNAIHGARELWDPGGLECTWRHKK